jgi:hypothetical protein
MKKIIVMLLIIGLFSFAYAADFSVESKTKTHYRIDGLNEEYVLTEGQKLADIAEIVAFANKTVPTGKKVTVAVNIDIMEVEDVE